MTLVQLTDLLEALTIFCFGLSWPLSIRKSLISRTSKGKSLFFEVFILIGYAFGFIFYLGFFFYVLNFVEIAFDIFLYFRNAKLDRERDAKA